jgi:hypothetical protein
MSQRRPRLVDPKYLEWLRNQYCACGCHQPPPCDPAHLRASSLKHDKPLTGMGRKPDDRWALPLKHAHHMKQHEWGDEVGWWKSRGVSDPFGLCNEYYFVRFGGKGGTPRKNKPKSWPAGVYSKQVDESFMLKPKGRRLYRARADMTANAQSRKVKIASRPFPKRQRGLR